MENTVSWLLTNYIEIFGAALGILGVYFQIKQNIWVWPLGIIASAFYIIVFFSAQLYALMSLQLYFIAISIYGWYQWKHPQNQHKEKERPIIRLNFKNTMIYLILFIGLWLLLFLFFKFFTNDSSAVWDSVVTALSLVASLMLAKKFIEQWLVWILADSIALVLYFFKQLYPTVIFYLILVVMAIIGFKQWKKEITSSA